MDTVDAQLGERTGTEAYRTEQQKQREVLARTPVQTEGESLAWRVGFGVPCVSQQRDAHPPPPKNRPMVFRSSTEHDRTSAVLAHFLPNPPF